MAVVLILIFGLIIRGVLSIQSNTSTDERVASEDIAFDIVAETPRTQGGTDEKLYQERLANSQSKTVPEDVKYLSMPYLFLKRQREKHIPLLRIVHKFPAQRRVTPGRRTKRHGENCHSAGTRCDLQFTVAESTQYHGHRRVPDRAIASADKR